MFLPKWKVLNKMQARDETKKVAKLPQVYSYLCGRLMWNLSASARLWSMKISHGVSVSLLVWRCLVRSEESLQESHGFPSGSSLHATRNSLSFSRGLGKITGVGSSLWVEAVLIVSGDRKVSSVIVRRPRLSANSSTDWPESCWAVL